jgi:hypothetical protein
MPLLLVETGIHEKIGDERLQPLLLEEMWGILASWQRRSREAPAGASTRIWRSEPMLLLYLEAATRAVEKNDVRCSIWIGKGYGREEITERNVFFD